MTPEQIKRTERAIAEHFNIEPHRVVVKHLQDWLQDGRMYVLFDVKIDGRDLTLVEEALLQQILRRGIQTRD